VELSQHRVVSVLIRMSSGAISAQPEKRHRMPVGDTGTRHCADLDASESLHDNYGMSGVHPHII
jgi:hypothetical protein